MVHDICESIGAERGASNPCVYCHREWQVSLFHHGDDFVVEGKRGGAEKLRKALGERLIIKHRGTLGPRDSDASEMTILHRIVRWCKGDAEMRERIGYEADP